ncbi:MAG TPA: ABC transporter ATP-binding protein, partial [Marinobacter sp.]
QGGRFPAETAASKPAKAEKSVKKAEPSVAVQAEKPRPKASKLSYKLKLELEQLPGQIEQLETEVAGLQEKISAPDFYNGVPGEVAATLDALSQKEIELEQVIERWMELEEQAGQ